MIRRSLISLVLLMILNWPLAAQTSDYAIYHQSVICAEQLMGQKEFDEALSVYEDIFEDFDFIFLREYQVAAQLAVFTGRSDVAFDIMENGMKNGWSKKSIRKHDLLKSLKNEPQWKVLMKQGKEWRNKYLQRLETEQMDVVHHMYKRDQWKALGALFKLSSKAQDRYAEKKFAPHSEKQMQLLNEMLNQSGYPGERQIGNEVWMSTILSHHNSISKAYNQQDTLYAHLQPLLLGAWKKGQVAPFSLALIDEWYLIVSQDVVGYGILNDVSESALTDVNARRAAIGMRSIELRNILVDISEETQIDFHLPGAGLTKGKIKILSDQ